ncbi:hypothetical protein [Sphaerisporangium perillae]|uniref:hypothetical protein n=1 Tax=Sphaerisporangium perillae TaxID=2935860 RepID=UPI00200FD082|nr:hypothetical protein [Sphaerisporangium perillae]
MTPSKKSSASLGALLRAGTVAATVTATLVAGAVAADAAAIPEFKQPKLFGTSFQADPHHDFTKRISTRHDGILRGWVTYYKAGVAEYTPIKWVKDKTGNTEGWFTGPPEGDATAYASPVSSKLAYYGATACKGTDVTVNRQGLGNKRCSRKATISLLKAGRHPGLITVYKGKIVKFQEIYTP